MAERPTDESRVAVVVAGGRGRVQVPLAPTSESRSGSRRAQLVLTGVLAAGPARARVERRARDAGEAELALELDPRTPPGRYEAVVTAEGRTIPLEVVVAAERRAAVAPARVTLAGRPGESVEVAVVVQNDGNVPLALADPEPRYLGPDDRVCKLLRGALEESQGGVAGFFDAVVEGARKSWAEDLARLLRTTVTDAPGELAPGAASTVTLRFEIPKTLEPGRGYRAAVELAGQRVQVEVRCEHPTRRTKR